MSTQTQVETTGIRGADEFAAKARELGLTVEVKLTRSEATYYRDGVTVMLPAVLTVKVEVSIPVPEELNGTALGMMERANVLTSYWNKQDKPRARGRWVLANHSTFGSHEDMHVMSRMNLRLETMANDLKSLRKLVQG